MSVTSRTCIGCVTRPGSPCTSRISCRALVVVSPFRWFNVLSISLIFSFAMTSNLQSHSLNSCYLTTFSTRLTMIDRYATRISTLRPIRLILISLVGSGLNIPSLHITLFSNTSLMWPVISFSSSLFSTATIILLIGKILIVSIVESCFI